MKKSEMCVVDETLEAPIRLTPEQLESVAAGFIFQLPHFPVHGFPTIGFPRGPKGGPVGFAPIKLFS